jgi:hypothetical protein
MNDYLSKPIWPDQIKVAIALGIAAGFLFTPAPLRSPWLWFGIALAFVIFLPNFLWQIRHHLSP